MAYSSSTNYYNTTISNSYASNISGQITRIKDAHKAIRSKAIEMGLKIPAAAKLTTNASGTSELTLDETHHILDTAAAINNLPVNTHTNQTIGAGSSYTVPVGYNKTAYTVTASKLDGQTSGTALAADILVGKTAWVNGSQITGSMKDKTGDQTASGFSYYTSDNVNYLYLTIPETGKYEAGKQLKSNIIYNTIQDLEIPVTITTASTGETIVEASKKVFSAGYYSGINIKAVYKTGASETNKIINIDNAVGQLTAQSGNLTISSGYDYFASNASYTIREGVISAVTASVNTDTGVITYGGGSVTTSGWVSSAITKPTTYTPPTAVFNKNATTGKVSVSTAGWVTAGTEVGGLNSGSVTLSGVTASGSSATTVNNVSIGANSYYVKVDVGAGYVTSSHSTALDLGAATITSASSTGTPTTTITSQKWQVNVAKGYNPSTATRVFQVQAGTISNSVSIDSNYIGTLKVNKSGWINSQTITLNIPAKDQTYTISNTDLVETDHTFQVAAASGTLMKSLSIDMTNIYTRLAAI